MMTGAIRRACVAGLVAVPLILFGRGADAQTADCGTAGSAYGSAVCQSALLQAQNRDMKQAYADLFGSLSAAGRTILNASQHGWLLYARGVCDPDGNADTPSYDAEGVSCLVDLLRERVGRLRELQPVNGYRVVPLDVFRVQLNPETDIPPRVGSVAYSVELLDADDALADGFNRFVRAGYSGGNWSLDSVLSDFDGGQEIKVSGHVVEVTSRRVTSQMDFYGYFGGAHGSSSISYEHYLVPEQRALAAGDIFTGNNWQGVLAGLVLKALRADPELSDALWEEIDGMEEMVADPTRWRFTSRGIEFQFLPYEVAAYVYGLPAVTVPWQKLAPLLAPGAMDIASAG